MEQKKIIRIAAFSGALAVAFGAFGAHGLQQLTESGKLDADDLRIFEVAVRYHFYHTFALIALAALYGRINEKLSSYSAIAFITGMIIFSGSLYLLSVSGYLFGERLTWLGAITPLGGLALIAGWLLLFLSASRKKN